MDGPRTFKLSLKNPLRLRGHVIRLVGIDESNQAILSIEDVGEQQADLDIRGTKLDTKPNEI